MHWCKETVEEVQKSVPSAPTSVIANGSGGLAVANNVAAAPISTSYYTPEQYALYYAQQNEQYAKHYGLQSMNASLEALNVTFDF